MPNNTNYLRSNLFLIILFRMLVDQALLARRMTPHPMFAHLWSNNCPSTYASTFWVPGVIQPIQEYIGYETMLVN